MSIKDFIKTTFNTKSLDADFYPNSVVAYSTEVNIFYKELAIESCASLIAKLLLSSEFKTFEVGKQIRKENYYLLNVEPNQNINAPDFWKEVVTKLVYDNECLIIFKDNQMYVADDFKVDDSVFLERKYSNIIIGDLQLKQTFRESEVFYFKLNNKKIKRVVDGLYSDYGRLISTKTKAFRKKFGHKVIFKIDSNFSQTEESKAKFNKLLSEDIKKFFEAEFGALPLPPGINFTEVKDETPDIETAEIKKLADDVIKFVCAAFHIPPSILLGDVVDMSKITDNMLMLVLNPLAKTIQAELNRKLYGKQAFLSRSYVKIDTQKIRLVDLDKTATAAEKLFRIGVHDINDNLELVNKEPIDAAWASDHYVTKNYAEIQSQLGKGVK